MHHRAYFCVVTHARGTLYKQINIILQLVNKRIFRKLAKDILTPNLCKPLRANHLVLG